MELRRIIRISHWKNDPEGGHREYATVPIVIEIDEARLASQLGGNAALNRTRKSRGLKGCIVATAPKIIDWQKAER